MRNYTIATDSVTTTIKASSEDQAARKFAKSNNIQASNAEQLVEYYENLGGWCHINDTTHLS